MNIFVQDQSIRDILANDSFVNCKNYKLSPYPNNIQSFDITLLGTVIAQGLTFKKNVPDYFILLQRT